MSVFFFPLPSNFLSLLNWDYPRLSCVKTSSAACVCPPLSVRVREFLFVLPSQSRWFDDVLVTLFASSVDDRGYE